MLCVSFLISQVTVSIATHSAVHCTMEASSFFVAVTRFRLGKYEISTTGKTEKITERICLFTSRQVHQSKETVWSVLFVGQSFKEKITQHKINHYFAVSSNSRARMAIEVEEWIELWVKIKISISNHSPKTVENVQLKFSFFFTTTAAELEVDVFVRFSDIAQCQVQIWKSQEAGGVKSTKAITHYTSVRRFWSYVGKKSTTSTIMTFWACSKKKLCFYEWELILGRKTDNKSSSLRHSRELCICIDENITLHVVGTTCSSCGEHVQRKPHKVEPKNS